MKLLFDGTNPENCFNRIYLTLIEVPADMPLGADAGIPNVKVFIELFPDLYDRSKHIANFEIDFDLQINELVSEATNELITLVVGKDPNLYEIEDDEYSLVAQYVLYEKWCKLLGAEGIFQAYA